MDKPMAATIEVRYDGPEALDPPPSFGEVIEATVSGTDLRITARWGTSPLGSEWEVISGDWLGHLPTTALSEIVRP